MSRKAITSLLVAAALGAGAAAFEDNFRDVPVADRPWCYWWWLNSHVDEAAITGDLEAMRRIGFGGLLLFDVRGYGDGAAQLVQPKPVIEFMSPEWRKLLAHALREAARLGLEVSVNLSSCGGALKGPWAVGADAPKRLVYQILPLSGGTAVNEVLPAPDLGYFRDIATFAVRYEGPAVTESGGWRDAGGGPRFGWGGKKREAAAQPETREALEIVELTDRVGADRRLAWRVPQGRWALVRFGYATIDGHEYDVDVLDAKAVEGHFNRMGKTILADAGPLAGKTLTHFYNVSWEGMVPTWTGAFEQDFVRFRGYAIRPWMPVLAGFTVRGPEASQRFVTDYRRARNEVFREDFYSTMMALCHANGLRWHAESGGAWNRDPAVFGEADQLAFLGRNDMPQGEFWYRETKRQHGRDLNRPQAMTAHIYGRRLAAAEAFTHMIRHWSAYPAVLKPAADEAFCDGVNQLIWHTFTCSPPAFGQPGIEYFAGTHINPNVTWHRQAGPFIAYLGRCQYLLRQGLSVADVCAYTGDVPYQDGDHPYATNWSGKATMALPKGYGYDLINNEVLLTRTAVKDGKIVLPDGMSYRVLAVDLDSDQAAPAALRRIGELKRDGATVVFGGRRPRRVAGLGGRDDEVERLGEALWADSPTLEAALKTAGPAPDFEGPFAFTHRRDGETDLYFVAGTGKAECAFRVAGKQAELWDPVTGLIAPAAGGQRSEAGRTVVTLDLPQDGSVFVVFRKQKSEVSDQRSAQPASDLRTPTSLPLEGPWNVTFQAGRGAPAEAVFDTLIDWATHADPGIKYFSGTATYCKIFDVTAEQAGLRAVLQLGRVAALAQVKLNGKDLGIVWTAPWRAELTGALKAGRNELEVEVTNPWANRLVGDAGLPPEQRVTKSNMAFEKGRRTLKLYQGFASGDALHPSGLMGPVSVAFFK